MKKGSYQMVFGKFPGQFSKKVILARDIHGEKAMRDYGLETGSIWEESRAGAEL